MLMNLDVFDKTITVSVTVRLSLKFDFDVHPVNREIPFFFVAHFLNMLHL